MCREEDTAWQGTRAMVKPFLTSVKLPAQRWEGAERRPFPLLPRLLPTLVPPELRRLESATGCLPNTN